MAKTFKRHGFDWDSEQYADPWLVEAVMYNDAKLRTHAGTGIWQHLRQMIKLEYPDHIFTWHRWVDELGELWGETPIATVWGAASTGKSGVAAMFGWQHLLIAPQDTMVILATFPHTAHNNRCWGSMKQWMGHGHPTRHGKQVGRFRVTPSMGFFTNIELAKESGVKCITAAPGEKEEDLQKKIGVHQKRSLLICDEPQGCSASILGIGTNFFASGEGRELFIGNPKGWEDPLGRHSLPWAETEEDRAKECSRILTEGMTPGKMRKWKTRNRLSGQDGYCIVLDGRECPTLDSPEEAARLHFLHQPDHMDDIRATLGEDSQTFWSQIIGRIMPGGRNGTAMSIQDLIRFGGQSPALWSQEPTVWAGLDPSEGTDAAQLTFILEGLDMAGRPQVAMSEELEIPLLVAQGDVSGQIAAFVKAEMDKRGVPIERLGADANGNQNAVVDRIESLFGQNRMAYRMLSGGAPKVRPLPEWQGKGMIGERYQNEATWIFYRPLDLLQSRQLKNLSPSCSTELTNRLLDTSKVRLAVETKSDYRIRNRGKSPNKADALTVALVMLHERGVLKAMGPPATGEVTVEKSFRFPPLRTGSVEEVVKSAMGFNPRIGPRQSTALGRARW